MEFTNICNARLLKAGSVNFLVLIKTPNYLESHTKSETKCPHTLQLILQWVYKKKFKKGSQLNCYKDVTVVNKSCSADAP
mgnify:CR=1 FL=1